MTLVVTAVLRHDRRRHGLTVDDAAGLLAGPRLIAIARESRP
jgi:hypothetical protein